MKSRETETFSRPDILGLTGTETSTETRKVSVPRVSAPRPPISGAGVPEEAVEAALLVLELEKLEGGHIQGASKKMTDSEIILFGAFRDCLLLSMKLGTLI